MDRRDTNIDNSAIAERFPARVQTDFRGLPQLDTGNAALDLNDREQVMQVIRQHATDPTIFDNRLPFIWVARISNNRTDYYYTRMDPTTTLRNFAEDAIAGVAFLDSHIQSQQPCGRSFAAKVVETEGVVDVYAAFYTIPDLTNTRINTNDLIDSIRSGITKDVSVGFKRGDDYILMCSICGGDINDWQDCPHFPGVRYSIPDENGGVHEVTCIGWVINGRLSEVSGVFDGATPTAWIEKAQNFAERGLLKPSLRETLERELRVTLHAAKSQQPAQLPPSTAATRQNSGKNDAEASQTDSKGERKMSNEEQENTAQNLTGFEQSLRSLGLIDDKATLPSLDRGIEIASNEIARLRAVETQTDELREAEITEALAQGVRAAGDKFDSEFHKNLFSRSTLIEIRKFSNEWRDKADDELGGGRRSQETEGDAEGTEDGKDTSDDKNRKVEIEAPLLPDNVFHS